MIAAFFLGILSSWHCVGMCGPIAFALPIHQGTVGQKWMKLLWYHLGRITTYGLIGVLFGVLGRTFFLAGLQQSITIFLGTVFVILALFQTKFIQKTEKMGGRIIGDWIKKEMAKVLKKQQNHHFFILGILNGWLPCGTVYIALIGAIATATIKEGFLYMLFFGLGTLPLMVGISGFKFFRNIINVTWLKKIVPIYFLIIGGLFILRGMGLGIAFISPTDASLQIQLVPIGCH